MKKTLALLLAVFTLAALSACAGGREEAVVAVTAPVESTLPQAAETPLPTPPTAPDTPAPAEVLTPEPSAAQEKGIPYTLTSQQQYEANLFLSNFSEQSFCEMLFDRFDADNTGVAQLFSFAHLWAKINNRSVISYEGSYETMKRADYIDIVYRYFALETFPEPTEGEDYSAELGIGRYDWDHCWYSGECFYYPAADGESYNRFTVVDEALSYTDGRSLFRFTVYELNFGVYRDKNGIPAEYYRLTPAEAVDRMVKGEITPVRTGEALCTPCYLESSKRQSYNLIRYELDALS